MKILYLTNSFPTQENPMNGIFNLRRVEHLMKKGIEVHVVNHNSLLQRKGIRYKKDYDLKDIGFETGLKVRVLNYIRNPLFDEDPHLIGRIARMFKEGGYDLIQTHFTWNGYLGYLINKRYGIPYILTVHGSDIHTDPFKSRKVGIKTLKALNNAERVIFVSEFLHRKACELGYRSANYEIIPNGIDIEKIEESGNMSVKKPDEKIVGFVGGLCGVKRAGLLPEIFYRIRRRSGRIKFMIVGGGFMLDEITENLAKYGILKDTLLTGSVHPDEVWNYMKIMDVLVLPSINEGFPCVVKEAFACGVQVVGSSNGGIPEAIGDCGTIVPEGENFTDSFADKVVRALDAGVPKRKLMENSKNYSWDKIVAREIKVYSEIISGSLPFGA
jgi:teichuronic acid biosynthesis glycosyltransferase TuaC